MSRRSLASPTNAAIAIAIAISTSFAIWSRFASKSAVTCAKPATTSCSVRCSVRGASMLMPRTASLTVPTDNEAVLGISIDAPRTLQRTLQLVVAGFAQVTADLDANLDQIAKEVEIAMAMAMAALVGLAKDLRLIAVQIEMAGTAQKPTGRIALTYEVDYFTLENAP